MKIANVKIGSKIKIVDEMLRQTNGLVGRVIKRVGSESYVFVSDEAKPYLHDCRGLCEDYHGWFLHSSTQVIVLKEKEEKKGGGILKEGMVIHCKNGDERVAFEKLITQELGINVDGIVEGYKRYGNSVCYRIGTDRINYGTKNCAYSNDKIIEFSDLVKNKSNKIEKDILYGLPSYVDLDVKLVAYKGNETRVELKSGYTGIAKCSEGDVFDREIGYKIAYNRAKVKELNDELMDRALLLEQLVEGE